MQQLPDLNVARCGHNSTCLGEAVYVACGWGGKQESAKLNSVERLWMGTGSGEES